eukprot:6333372-Pyramimonas_sp.AAC.1
MRTRLLECTRDSLEGPLLQYDKAGIINDSMRARDATSKERRLVRCGASRVTKSDCIAQHLVTQPACRLFVGTPERTPSPYTGPGTNRGRGERIYP